MCLTNKEMEVTYSGCLDIPPQDIILYCNSDDTITGCHYDPIVLRGSGRVSRSPSRAKRGERTKKETLGSNGAPKRQKRQRKEDVDPHDEEPTFMKVVSHCPWNTSCNVDGCNKDSKRDLENNDVHLNENTVDAENMFYKVSAMHSWDTPDHLRRNLEEALEDLTLRFRSHPTLPADPTNPFEEFPSSASCDKAILLPSKHCAFTGCSWCGTDALSQIDHLMEVHEE